MLRKILSILLVALSALVLVAGVSAYAQGQPIAPQPNSVEVDVQATVTTGSVAQPGVQKGAFRSLGLGRKRVDWESENGAPSTDGRWKVYKNGMFRVLFTNDHVWHLRRKWDPNQAPHLAQARAVVNQRLPDDLKLVKTNVLSERLFIETYYSAGLVDQFGATTGWPGDRRPGTFLVMYHLDPGLPGGDAVTLLEIKVGNNPLVDNQ